MADVVGISMLISIGAFSSIAVTAALKTHATSPVKASNRDGRAEKWSIRK